MNNVLTRPDRIEELRLEAASRATSGPWAYRGTRECQACEHQGTPLHPDESDRQTCSNCGADLPGDPVTWTIRDLGEEWLLVLRHGEHCMTKLEPKLQTDEDVIQVHAANAWLNLEWALGLVKSRSRH